MDRENEKNKELQKGEGFPQILHDRARGAGEELVKLVISLSTAIFSVHFFSITTSLNKYTSNQKLAIIIAIICMGLSIFAGIITWYADARKNFFWATALQKTDKSSKTKYYKLRDKWLWITRLNTIVFATAFTSGIVSSVIAISLILFY